MMDVPKDPFRREDRREKNADSTKNIRSTLFMYTLRSKTLGHVQII